MSLESAFRAQVSAAPLKPYRNLPRGKGGAALPRSSERGPVEARIVGDTSGGGVAAFRAQVSAAPLKPDRSDREVDSQVSAFRAQVSAAPLKPLLPGVELHQRPDPSALK